MGVEFSCRKCGAKVLYPLNKHYDRLLQKCPNCNEDWFVHNELIHPSIPQAAEQVVSVVTQLRQIVERNDIRANIRLLVANAPKA